MRKWIALTFVVVPGLWAWTVYGQGTSVPLPPVTSDEAGFNQMLAAYANAYNKQDVAGIMQFWAADAEYISETGTVTKSREAIGELFKKMIANHPGTSLKLKVTSLRFLKADIALQDGVADLKAPDGSIDSSPFTAVWVKSDGKWLLSRVRDLPDATPSHDENGIAKALRDLDWLVGEWVHEEGPTKVTMTGHWVKGNAFLILDQTVFNNGEEILFVKQIVGWDPHEEQLRSWLFDSKGSFGGGMWTRQGNQWNVDSTGTLSDGRIGTATNTWKYLSDDRFEWLSTNREIDGRPSPDIRAQYTRKGKR